MKNLLFILMLFISITSSAQNGYVKQTITGSDTTTLFLPGQIYWKLYQGVDDDIVESKMNTSGDRDDVKYPIISREYDGFIKEYVVKGRNIESFTIRFHTRDHTVTYISEHETVIYRGEHINFRL